MNTINNHVYSDWNFSEQLLMECLQRWTFSSCQAYAVPWSVLDCLWEQSVCGAFAIRTVGELVWVLDSSLCPRLAIRGDAAVKTVLDEYKFVFPVHVSSFGHGHPEDSGQCRQSRGNCVALVCSLPNFASSIVLLSWNFVSWPNGNATTQVSILAKRSSEKGEAPRRLARCQIFATQRLHSVRE